MSLECSLLSNLSEFVSGDLKLVSGLLGAVSCLSRVVSATRDGIGLVSATRDGIGLVRNY